MNGNSFNQCPSLVHSCQPSPSCNFLCHPHLRNCLPQSSSDQLAPSRVQAGINVHNAGVFGSIRCTYNKFDLIRKDHDVVTFWVSLSGKLQIQLFMVDVIHVLKIFRNCNFKITLVSHCFSFCWMYAPLSTCNKTLGCGPTLFSLFSINGKINGLGKWPLRFIWSMVKVNHKLIFVSYFWGYELSLAWFHVFYWTDWPAFSVALQD